MVPNEGGCQTKDGVVGRYILVETPGRHLNRYRCVSTVSLMLHSRQS